MCMVWEGGQSNFQYTGNLALRQVLHSKGLDAKEA